jgi:hypothetical protein
MRQVSGRVLAILRTSSDSLAEHLLQLLDGVLEAVMLPVQEVVLYFRG